MSRMIFTEIGQSSEYIKDIGQSEWNRKDAGESLWYILKINESVVKQNNCFWGVGIYMILWKGFRYGVCSAPGQWGGLLLWDASDVHLRWKVWLVHITNQYSLWSNGGAILMWSHHSLLLTAQICSFWNMPLVLSAFEHIEDICCDITRCRLVTFCLHRKSDYPPSEIQPVCEADPSVGGHISLHFRMSEWKKFYQCDPPNIYELYWNEDDW